METRDKRNLWQARIDPAEVSQLKIERMRDFELSYMDDREPEAGEVFWNTQYINMKRGKQEAEVKQPKMSIVTPFVRDTASSKRDKVKEEKVSINNDLF